MKKTLLAVQLATVLIAGGACHRGSAEASPPNTASVTGTKDGAPFATPPVLSGTPDIAALVAKVKPAVVSITTTHQIKARGRTATGQGGAVDPFGEFFGRGDEPRNGGGDRVRKQQALGSGFLVDNAGHVVTNAHVVEDADSVKVRLADDREFAAKVKGRDERLDLAVLELQGAKDLPQASLGSSEGLRVGEYVVAIGNPFGLGATVTMGIVSAKSRSIGAGPYDDFIQTDASINPGNSGGPLFNLNGQVVGINTAINPNGQGIGFAIPSDALKDVLQQLLTKGRVARGRLGVVIQPVDETMAKALGMDRSRGALVADVEPGGPADRAGVKSGDLIIGVDGTEVPHSQDLPRLIARHAPGSQVSVKVRRETATRDIGVTLEALKEEGARAQMSDSEGRTPDFGLDLEDAPGGGALVRRSAGNDDGSDALRPGDVIVEANHAPVRAASEAAVVLKKADASKPVLLKVKREGRMLFIAISKA